MRVAVLVVVPVVVIVLGACEEPWPTGTRIHAEAPGADERRAATWHAQVMVARDHWTLKLGADCAFPFEVVAAATDDSRPIRLVQQPAWDGGTDVGYWYWDGGIDIRDDEDPNYLIYTTMHELGHAMSGGWHSDDSEDLMSTKGSGQVTDNDVRRMRGALGCD